MNMQFSILFTTLLFVLQTLLPKAFVFRDIVYTLDTEANPKGDGEVFIFHRAADKIVDTRDANPLILWREEGTYYDDAAKDSVSVFSLGEGDTSDFLFPVMTCEEMAHRLTGCLSDRVLSMFEENDARLHIALLVDDEGRIVETKQKITGLDQACMERILPVLSDIDALVREAFFYEDAGRFKWFEIPHGRSWIDVRFSGQGMQVSCPVKSVPECSPDSKYWRSFGLDHFRYYRPSDSR